MATEEGTRGVSDLINQCDSLTIRGGEEELFDLGEETEDKAEQRHILLGTRLTRRGFNYPAMGRTLINTWKTAMGAQWKVIEENLYIFEFHHKRDMERVLEEGPWHFDGQMVLLKPVTDEVKLCREELNTVRMWVQIHKLPLSRVTPITAQKLGAQIGEVKEIDRGSGKGLNTLFLRVQVEIDANKPLKGRMKVGMGAGKQTEIEFRYEKLPNVCYWCGMLDHVDRECIKGLEAPEGSKPPLGDWMRTASFQDSKAQNTGRRFGAGWTGFGRSMARQSDGVRTGKDLHFAGQQKNGGGICGVNAGPSLGNSSIMSTPKKSLLSR